MRSGGARRFGAGPPRLRDMRAVMSCLKFKDTVARLLRRLAWRLPLLSGVSCVLVLPRLIWDGGRLAQKESLCPFLRLSGLPCPGCGLTKSIAVLYDGRLAESLNYNPLGVVIAACCAAVAACALFDVATGRRSLDRFLGARRIWQTVAVGYTAYYLFRVASSFLC